MLENDTLSVLKISEHITSPRINTSEYPKAFGTKLAVSRQAD